jgi:hypothetical protein
VVGSLRGSDGAAASAAASRTARVIDASETCPRAPRHAHGAPPRPVASAAPCAIAKTVISPAAAYAAASIPAATVTPSTSSTATSAPHTSGAAERIP